MKEVEEADIIEHELILKDRRIGELGGVHDGPVLVFVGGIHGNEPSGVYALQEVFDRFKDRDGEFRGKAYAFAGNLRALNKKQRYLDVDLNRLWYDEQISRLETIHPDEKDLPLEVVEQLELFNMFPGPSRKGEWSIYVL